MNLRKLFLELVIIQLIYQFFISSFKMKLDQFLKWKGVGATGGQAKNLIGSGLVTVNNQLETRRGRKLNHGDLVCFGNNQYIFSDSDTQGSKLDS